MAIIFRNNGPWGAGQGSRLSSMQVDENFYDHEQRIDSLEDPDSDDFVGIATISADASGLLITLTDGSTRGPFALPIPRLKFRTDVNDGEWAASTLYKVNDLFTESGILYVVLFEHTSGLTFDPGANNGGGQDYYRALLREPFRGVGGQTISTTAYILVSTDVLSPYLRITNVAGCAVHIPSGDDDHFQLWDEIHLRAATDGPVVIDWDCDTTVNVPDGQLPELLANGAAATLKKVGDNEWDLMGRLVETSDSF